MKRFPISRSQFQWWLTVRKDQVVGTTSGPCECPLANCLHDRGLPKLCVGQRAVYQFVSSKNVTGFRQVFQLPQWATFFITNLDELAKALTQVRGRVALVALAEAQRQQWRKTKQAQRVRDRATSTC